MKTVEFKMLLDEMNKRHKGNKQYYNGIYFDDDMSHSDIYLTDAKRKEWLVRISTKNERDFEINSSRIIDREGYPEALVIDAVKLAIEYAYTPIERRNEVDLFYIASRGVGTVEPMKLLRVTEDGILSWQEVVPPILVGAHPDNQELTFTEKEIERLPRVFIEALETGRLEKIKTKKTNI